MTELTHRQILLRRARQKRYYDKDPQKRRDARLLAYYRGTKQYKDAFLCRKMQLKLIPLIKVKPKKDEVLTKTDKKYHEAIKIRLEAIQEMVNKWVNYKRSLHAKINLPTEDTSTQDHYYTKAMGDNDAKL